MSYYPNRQDTNVAVRWILWAVLIVGLLLVAGWFLKWFETPLELTDPDRLQRISREANESYQALDAARANVQTIRDQMLTMKSLYGEDMSQWPQGKDDEYLQLQVQLTNRVSAYNALCTDYRAKWANEWWEFSAPKDLPTTCELMN